MTVKLRLCALAAFICVLGACATAGKAREEELARIAAWLPGDYSNLAQVQEDMAGAAVDVHQPIAMSIVPVYIPFLGKQVYYMQQTDATNPRRVLAQQLYQFEGTGDGKLVVQTLFSFKEPGRWVGGHLRSDIFKGLVEDDIATLTGCELLWKFDGKQFVAANSSTACRMPSLELNRHVNVEQRVELEQHELRISDRQFDASGRLLAGRAAQPFFRFAKQ